MSDSTDNEDGAHRDGLLLGKNTPAVPVYSPDILFPIARSEGRSNLASPALLAMHGADLWHAYELSWLEHSGKPVSRVGQLIVPASSPNIVESKSLKLYFNSLNREQFASEDEVRKRIVDDVSTVAGERVSLHLHKVDSPQWQGSPLHGLCLDDLPIDSLVSEPHAELLQIVEGSIVEQQLYTHLLRSLCPVTGQPDWATVWIHYKGPELERTSVLRYILSYREHQEFHEQCVERMFVDALTRIDPEFLHIQAFYTRRGGLDINPLRSTLPDFAPLPRLPRQ